MPVFSLPALDGSQFDLSDVRGKKVIFTFFRFSSCPFCNVRIDRIVKRWGEFADDTVMVGVFDADIGDLRKRMVNQVELLERNSATGEPAHDVLLEVAGEIIAIEQQLAILASGTIATEEHSAEEELQIGLAQQTVLQEARNGLEQAKPPGSTPRRRFVDAAPSIDVLG